MKLFLLALALGSVAAQTQNIVDLASSLGLTTLVTNLANEGLADALRGTGPFTVFAPTNAAFAALGSTPANLQAVLQYHVHSGRVPSSAITNNQLLTTLNANGKIRMNVYTVSTNTVITASGRVVSNPDNSATNGVIHVVDAVLIPPPGNIVAIASGDDDLDTLTDLVTRSGLVDALSGPETSPLTVFAPTDAAFTANPVDDSNLTAVAEILKYHVVSGAFYSSALSNGMVVSGINQETTNLFISIVDSNVYVNDAQVVAADVTATNGVVHKINKPLPPPGTDLVDLAIAQGLSQLVDAVTAASLVETLRGGPFTVFAPTNAAFEAAGIDTSDIPRLTRVLQYHLVSTVTYDFALKNDMTITTVQGSALTVDITGSTVTLQGVTNSARVTATNVQASNGVVHLIDAVLDPDTPTTQDPTGAAAGLSASLALAVFTAAGRLL